MLPTNEKMSAHFYYSELIDSDTAARMKIPNIPAQFVYETALKTADKMEAVRTLLGNQPLHVNSWYRCPELNMAIGGVATSQHCSGEAVDFVCRTFGTPQDICVLLDKHKDKLDYDQLIFEHTWVHISFNWTKRRPNRRQTLTLLSNGKYALGITDKSGSPLYTD